MAETISASVYDLQRKWMEEIAPKYLDLNETNKLRAGLFGYVNEVMANIAEDSLHMFNVMSNEIFPNRAVMPNSIYAYSALSANDNFNSVPAVIPFMLGIRKKDIIEYATQKTGYKELVISRRSRLMIEDEIPFLLDYDIRITARPTLDNKDYVLNAQYIIDAGNPLSDITNPYIKSVVLKEQGEEFLFLRLTGRQLERSEKRFIAMSNDVVERMSFDVEVEGKLAGFNVYYRAPGSDSEILLTKYFIDSYSPEEKYYCFYSYPSEDTINIFFSVHPSAFKPEFNSQIRVEIYTTLGKEGNFTYTGNAASFHVYDETGRMGNILTFASVLGDSFGGRDRPSLEEIKNANIKEFSSRGNLITETDLQNYFADKSLNSRLYFVKKRDDIIRRIYSSFVLLRNAQGLVVPTNTVHCRIHESKFTSNTPKVLTLKAGSLLEPESGQFWTPGGPYDQRQLMDLDRNSYIYGCPFLIRVFTEPHFVSYYMNSVMDDYTMGFSYLNEDALDEFLVHRISVRRNAIKTDQYRITATLMSSVPPDQVYTTDQSGNFVDLGGIRVFGVFRKGEEYLGYFKMNIVGVNEDGGYRLEGVLETDDFVDEEDRLNLVNSVYSLDQATEYLLPSFALDQSGVDIDFFIYYNGYPNIKTKGQHGARIAGMDDYCLTNIYSTEENVQLIKDLNTIVSSTLLVDVDQATGEKTYTVKSVPVVRYVYLREEESFREVVDLLRHFKNVLTEALDYVENNFNIDLKFYNTWGPSKFFTIGRGKSPLNRTSISIALNMKVPGGEVGSLLTEDFKNYITLFIEGTNSEETNFLYVSNLIRRLEEDFPQISYIEFLGFNVPAYDSSFQIIENNFAGFDRMTREQVINFVPEYLNVSRRPVTDQSGRTRFEPEITINFV